MANDDDPEVLARRYLDLWQDQITALAADPEFAETLGRLMSSMGLAGAGSADDSTEGAVQQGGDSAGHERDGGSRGADIHHSKPAAETPGSAAARPAPDHGGFDLGEFAARLDAFEQRLDQLERALGQKGRRPGGKSRGSAS